MNSFNISSSVNMVSFSTDAISRVIPREFEEVNIRIFTRFKPQAEFVQQVFVRWCNQHRAPNAVATLTPMKRTHSDL